MTNAQPPSQQLPAQTASDLSGTSRPIPLSWVERIFGKMVSHYGARFADAWRGCDMHVVKADWAEELGGYSATELRAGIDGLKTRDWPPTLPEFLKLCRPPINPDAAFVEAVREYRKRFADGTDNWSRVEIFWAAQAIGYHDLTTKPYDQVRNRWKVAIEAAKRDPIPVHLPALPARGAVVASPETVRRVFDELDARLAAKAATDRAMFRAKPAVKPHTPEYLAALADIEAREAARLQGMRDQKA